MKQKQTNYWVYILLCENGNYYTGYTNNIEKRYLAHFHGTSGCKYTRSFKPIAIVQCWIIDNDKSLAMRLEKQIKKLSRKEKEALISDPTTLTKDACVTIYKIPT